MKTDSSFIPNAYQTPNAYVDKYLSLLTPEEWVVLSYAIRRIIGFNKRSDKIALSQFAEGTMDRSGIYLDRGCGLSVNTIRKVLQDLCRFGFLIRLQENDPRVNAGPEFALQLDDSKINMSALLSRQRGKSVEGKRRTKKAIVVMRAKRRQYPLMSDMTTPPHVGHDHPPHVPQHHPPHVGREDNKQDKQGKTEIQYTTEAISEMTVPQIKAVPEMKLFLEVTGSDLPAHARWASIVLFIHKHIPSREVMVECWNEWAIKKGYRANDLTWLFEWTIKGIPKYNGKGKGKVKTTSAKQAGELFRRST